MEQWSVDRRPLANQETGIRLRLLRRSLVSLAVFQAPLLQYFPEGGIFGANPIKKVEVASRPPDQCLPDPWLCTGVRSPNDM